MTRHWPVGWTRSSVSPVVLSLSAPSELRLSEVESASITQRERVRALPRVALHCFSSLFFLGAAEIQGRFPIRADDSFRPPHLFGCARRISLQLPPQLRLLSLSTMSDEAASRALLLDSGTAEAVTVNQRALIDKILARYAAEFTVFRELIQNADDAGADCCELRFHSVDEPKEPVEGAAATPPNLKATLKRWVFRNNGKPFSGDDWNRLRVSPLVGGALLNHD